MSSESSVLKTPSVVPARILHSCWFALVAASLLLIFRDGLRAMVVWWEKPEYSHGYIIPLVAGFLCWVQLPLLVKERFVPSWLGTAGVVLALACWSLGEISSIYTIVQYALLLAIYALVLAAIGWRGLWSVWPALAYLIFMIPLPNFLYFNLSQELQLISSQLGVAVVRLLGVSVYLEGNVIDLGSYQLQVVEACSGLRYLFPLMSFGFLIAVLYRGPFWHRALIFLSTLPITILMNSFRIGVIGVSVEYWGIAAAEGFLHDFEGWVVFMACLGVLALVIWALNGLSGTGERTGLLERIDLSYPSLAQVSAVWAQRESTCALSKPLLAASMMLILAVPFSTVIAGREDSPPRRDPFTHFPLVHQGWLGRERALEADVLATLKLTDYYKAEYRRASSGLPIDFYVAYYASQRKGASIHSPRACLPGGGWQIKQHGIQPIAQGRDGIDGLKVNRVIIQQGENRMLTYYWFQQRGRVITDEYLAKWFIFKDALAMQRTDGALVRLVTSVPDGTDIASADQRLVAFLQDFGPLLADYIPD